MAEVVKTIADRIKDLLFGHFRFNAVLTFLERFIPSFIRKFQDNSIPVSNNFHKKIKVTVSLTQNSSESSYTGIEPGSSDTLDEIVCPLDRMVYLTIIVLEENGQDGPVVCKDRRWPAGKAVTVNIRGDIGLLQTRLNPSFESEI